MLEENPSGWTEEQRFYSTGGGEGLGGTSDSPIRGVRPTETHVNVGNSTPRFVTTQETLAMWHPTRHVPQVSQAIPRHTYETLLSSCMDQRG